MNDTPALPPPRPRKVCFVTAEYPPDWGGISKSARRIVGLLAEAGMEVHVFAPDRGTGGNGCEEPGPGPERSLTRVPITDEASGAVLPFVTAIYAADRREPFDIFHGFFLPYAFPCLALPERRNRPVVASIRGVDGTSMLEEGLFRQAIHTVLKKATWITSVSTDSLHRVAQVADIASRSCFIANSIESSGQRWALSANNRGVVGTLCTFRPKKDIPGLVTAYGRIAPPLRRSLRLVGDYFPSDTSTPTQVAAALYAAGVAAETTITGYVPHDRISPFLLGMNVFVLSSLHEGFPNTLLEAATLGLPIVATAVDGVKDLYGDSGAALLVPPGDPQALADAIARVLGDDALAQRLSQASVEVAARYSHDAERQAWVSLYERLLEAPAREGTHIDAPRVQALPAASAVESSRR